MAIICQQELSNFSIADTKVCYAGIRHHDQKLGSKRIILEVLMGLNRRTLTYIVYIDMITSPYVLLRDYDELLDMDYGCM